MCLIKNSCLAVFPLKVKLGERRGLVPVSYLQLQGGEEVEIGNDIHESMKHILDGEQPLLLLHVLSAAEKNTDYIFLQPAYSIASAAREALHFSC